MNTIKLLFCGVLIATTITLNAQTNPPAPPLPPIEIPSPNAIAQAATDFGKGFSDLGINISADDIGKAIIGLFFLARIARKYWLKDNGKLASIASHLSLEAPPQASVTMQVVQPAVPVAISPMVNQPKQTS